MEDLNVARHSKERFLRLSTGRSCHPCDRAEAIFQTKALNSSIETLENRLNTLSHEYR